MRIISATALVGVLGGGILGQCLAPGAPGEAAGAGASARQRGLARHEMHFERNNGQARSTAPFLARGPGYAIHLEPHALTLALRAPAADPALVRMDVLGASPQAALEGAQPLAAAAHYFVGPPARWRSNVPLYGQVRVREVYPGIDLVYYGSEGRLEYDFVVAPGADPGQIRLHFEGATTPRLDADGSLRLVAGGRALVQRAPVIYQERAGARRPVAGRYVVDDRGVVAIEVAAHDASQALVIDPVLVYSTLLGGGSEDIGLDIAVDAAGNAYVTGRTSSLDLPATEGAADTTPGGGGWSDAFVAKFDPTGSQLLYLTYLGGDGLDFGDAIAVDAVGNAVVAGTAELGGFPTTPGAYGDGGSGSGAFVAKLSADGASLLYSAVLAEAAEARAIALAGDGSVLVGGHTPNPDGDAFVARLSADGSQVDSAFTFGGDDYDSVNALALDALGGVYVAGDTHDGTTDFPATAGAFDESHNGLADAFVAKLDGAGTGFAYATLLGGSDSDYALALAVDSAGNAYVGGKTGDGSAPDQQGDFPTTPGAFQQGYEGQSDGFVARLDASGATLDWSTLIHADAAESVNSYEDVTDLALTPSGLLYVVGTLGAAVPFPVTAGAFLETPNGGGDGYLLLLSGDGATAVYASYVGGGFDDSLYGVAVDASGGAYLTGGTAPSDTPFPTTAGAYDRTHNNAPDASAYAGDAFVVRMHPLVDSAAQFADAALTVAADASSVVVDVVREGDAAGAFAVDYAAELAGGVIAEGTASWADGESGIQQIEIPLPAGASALAKSAAAGSTVMVALEQPNGRLGAQREMSVQVGAAAPPAAESGGAFGGWLLWLVVALAVPCRRPMFRGSRVQFRDAT